jgi:hypothetical protein
MVDVSLENDLNERNQQAEQHPDLNQLYIASLWKGFRDGNKPKNISICYKYG